MCSFCVFVKLFCIRAGEELFLELQRVLHPHHATVHEAGLRQDAHRLQSVHALIMRSLVNTAVC